MPKCGTDLPEQQVTDDMSLLVIVLGRWLQRVHVVLGQELLHPGLLGPAHQGVLLLVADALARVNAELTRNRQPTARKPRIHRSTGR